MAVGCGKVRAGDHLLAFHGLVADGFQEVRCEIPDLGSFLLEAPAHQTVHPVYVVVTVADQPLHFAIASDLVRSHNDRAPFVV